MQKRQKTHSPIVIESGRPGLVTALVTTLVRVAFWINKLDSILKEGGETLVAVNENQPSINSLRYTIKAEVLPELRLSFGFFSISGWTRALCLHMKSYRLDRAAN